MKKRARVKLLSGWTDYSRDNPDGPPTFLRDRSEVPGPLQVSMAEWVGGEVPNSSESDLVRLATDSGRRQEAGDLVETDSGKCDLGMYGTAVFRSQEYPRTQIWFLSNGRDFVMASHICPGEADDDEIKEA